MKMLIVIFLAGSLCLPSGLAYGQRSIDIFDEIPDNFRDPIIAMENEKGLLMSFRQFKKGKFVEASEREKRTLMTTMLLGSGTLLYNYFLKEYPDFSPVVLQPNGFTRSSFKIKYVLGHGEIFVMRLMHGLASSGAMAAEDPKNYALVYAFDFDDEKEMTDIKNTLIQILEENEIQYQMLDKP